MQSCFSLKGDLIILLSTCLPDVFLQRVIDSVTESRMPTPCDAVLRYPQVKSRLFLCPKNEFLLQEYIPSHYSYPMVWTEKISLVDSLGGVSEMADGTYTYIHIFGTGVGLCSGIWLNLNMLFVFVYTGSWSRQWHNKFCSEHHQYRNKQCHWQPCILFLVKKKKKKDLPQIVTKILFKLQIVFFLTDVQDGFCRERRDNFRWKFPWRIPG